MDLFRPNSFLLATIEKDFESFVFERFNHNHYCNQSGYASQFEKRYFIQGDTKGMKLGEDFGDVHDLMRFD